MLIITKKQLFFLSYFLLQFLFFWFDNFALFAAFLVSMSMQNYDNKMIFLLPDLFGIFVLLIWQFLMWAAQRRQVAHLTQQKTGRLCLPEDRAFFLFAYLRQDDVHADEEGHILW